MASAARERYPPSRAEIQPEIPPRLREPGPSAVATQTPYASVSNEIADRKPIRQSSQPIGCRAHRATISAPIAEHPTTAAVTNGKPWMATASSESSPR